MRAVASSFRSPAPAREVRGRKQIQEANELYKRGKYAEAVAAYEEAETLVPNLPTLWLNKGYTCRQLIAPGRQGSREPARRRLRARRVQASRRARAPGPARRPAHAPDLVRHRRLRRARGRTSSARNRRAPDDVDAVRGLQEVYFKWGKWREALDWSKRAAALRPDDAEAQYGVGTLRLAGAVGHGGGARDGGLRAPGPHPPAPTARRDRSPRRAARRRGERHHRRRCASSWPTRGIAYLERALALRPRYPEAMTYLALLWRQKSFAFFADPIAWQGAVDEADDWQKRAPRPRAPGSR